MVKLIMKHLGPYSPPTVCSIFIFSEKVVSEDAHDSHSIFFDAPYTELYMHAELALDLMGNEMTETTNIVCVLKNGRLLVVDKIIQGGRYVNERSDE